MAQHSDLNTTKIALIGGLGTIVTVVVTLVAIVLYLDVADRVEQSRSDEAATRIQGDADAIAAGSPIAQPWLDADLQRATQEVQLTEYRLRTIAEDGKPDRVAYSIPIEHAMESVLQEAVGSASQRPQNEGAE
jgi:hypothetical protein